MLREVKCPQRKVRVLQFIVDGTGTAAITSGAKSGVLTDNGVGDYTITFNTPGSRLLSAHAIALSDTGDRFCALHSDTGATKVRLLVWDATDGTTSRDCIFHVTVHLSDDADEQNG